MKKLILVLLLSSCASKPTVTTYRAQSLSAQALVTETMLSCSAEIKDPGFRHCGGVLGNGERVCKPLAEPLYHCRNQR